MPEREEQDVGTTNTDQSTAAGEMQDANELNDAPEAVDGEASFSSAPVEEETPSIQIRQLEQRIETLEKELAEEREKAGEYMNRAMRAQADASNIRKRLQQDLARAMQDMARSVVYEQLSVLDSFDRAFMSLPAEFRHFTWVEGVSMIQSQLFNILYRAGVTPIEAQGKKFDPNEHEAVAFEETSDQPEETVTAELQRGYKLHDQVLRPALVKIARAPQTASAGAAGYEAETTEM
jgi:molecular chaperone GrpE